MDVPAAWVHDVFVTDSKTTAPETAKPRRGVFKKALTHPAARALDAAFRPISKNALIDIVGDLLDQIHGEGGWSIHDAIEDAAPRLKVRGDREPKDWQPGCLRRAARH